MAGFGKETEALYAALIGDLVGSRELPDRGTVQDLVSESLATVNRGIGSPGGGTPHPSRPSPLIAPLAFTAGDEFQGLLASPELSIEIAVAIAEFLHPVKVVWGIGFGTLTTPPGSQPALLDGPCFHRAREAVERAKAEGRWVAFAGFGSAEDRELDAILRLLQSVRDRWTDKQVRYAHLARTEMRKDVADRFGVSPSVVSESLKAAAFDAVLEGEAAVRAMLARFGSVEPGRS